MVKKMRPLVEIYKEIEGHEQAIKNLRQEVKDFQAACPHPDNFVNVQHKSTDDEYGRIDSTYTIRTCVLCGFVQHTDHKDVY